MKKQSDSHKKTRSELQQLKEAHDKLTKELVGGRWWSVGWRPRDWAGQADSACAQASARDESSGTTAELQKLQHEHKDCNSRLSELQAEVKALKDEHVGVRFPFLTMG